MMSFMKASSTFIISLASFLALNGFLGSVYAQKGGQRPNIIPLAPCLASIGNVTLESTSEQQNAQGTYDYTDTYLVTFNCTQATVDRCQICYGAKFQYFDGTNWVTYQTTTGRFLGQCGMQGITFTLTNSWTGIVPGPPHATEYRILTYIAPYDIINGCDTIFQTDPYVDEFQVPL